MITQAISEGSTEDAQDRTRHDVFVRLIEQYEPALRRLTIGYAERREDREDMFQEIAVGLWQAIPKFRGDASERTWLYRIAHNIAISTSVRRRNRGRKESGMPEGLDYPSAAIDSEQEVLQSEKRALLTQAIRDLPAVDRQLALLHLEGLNYAQIEEISGMSQSAIASRLSRLRDRLRERLQAAERSSDGQ